MNEQQIVNLTKALDAHRNKTSRIFFLTMDTKGIAKAAIAYNYEIVKTLNDLGFKAFIMHEKNDYESVEKWLGSELASVPHVSIESKEVKVELSDLVIIPEVFGHVLEQTKQMPCEKLIMCNAYDYIFETLPPGMTWPAYNVHKCITTNERQGEMISSMMPNVNVENIKLYIPEYFKKYDKPQPPMISVHTRDSRDTHKVIKAFYVKFPQYKWITFRDLRNLSREKFAEDLSQSAISVWIDDISGFGTFPLESMKCGVPVIGKVPNLQPEWMTEKNGIWTHETNKIVDLLGSFVNKWLEDEVPLELYDEMEKTVQPYTKGAFEDSIETLFNKISERKEKEVRIQLEKLTPVGAENEN
tara:strand:- start:305 stop:1375 length:1071 start_codon:yes stop_codon:yes gene_type:complete